VKDTRVDHPVVLVHRESPPDDLGTEGHDGF
jgi:hypothetical protein